MDRGASDRVGEAAAFLREGMDHPARIAIVLGSGLTGLATTVEEPVAIPFSTIPGFPDPSVAGHSGSFIFGSLEGVSVVLQSGRLHLYEGHDPATIVLSVRALAEAGVEILIVTNAAGGIRRTFRPPTLMAIADHINLMNRSPLLGAVVQPEARFPDMSRAYDPELRGLALRVARQMGIEMHTGVYAGVHGPSYETPAEIRMLERMGADAVGMSTVPEVIAAHARGVRVLGISTITNHAAGLSPVALTHEEVLEAGRQMKVSLEALIRGLVRGL
jgi:purine-nucleoside phosphorylase